MITIWRNAPKYLLKQLQKIQNRAIRNIFNLPYETHRVEMYKQTNIAPLTLLRDLEIIVQAHKIITHEREACENLKPNAEKHGYATRQREHLQINQLNTNTYGSNSIAHKMRTLYNREVAENTKWIDPNSMKRFIKRNLMEKIQDYF